MNKNFHFSAKGSPLRTEIGQSTLWTEIWSPENRLALSSRHEVRIYILWVLFDGFSNWPSKFWEIVKTVKKISGFSLALPWAKAYAPELQTGGKPSTWLPPGGLEEQLVIICIIFIAWKKHTFFQKNGKFWMFIFAAVFHPIYFISW